MSTPRPRLWHIVVIALLGAFELVVLYLALTPHVQQDYYDYYISRDASCFPREDTLANGAYVLGTPVSFVPGRSGWQRDNLRWCGFMLPDKKLGIRSFGDYGIIRLRFDVPDEDLLLTFTSTSNATIGQPAREVGVVVNGTKLDTLTYASPARVLGHIVVPAAVAKAGADGLDIRFDVPRIAPPGTNSEPVTLQLRLIALRVSPLSQNKEAGVSPPPLAN